MRALIPFVEKLGLKLVLDEAYPPGTLDPEPILFKDKSLRADVVAGGGFLGQAFAVMKAAKAEDIKLDIFSLGAQLSRCGGLRRRAGLGVGSQGRRWRRGQEGPSR